MADRRFCSILTQLLCVLCVILAVFCNVGHNLDLSCIEVKKEYVNMGFPNDSSVPISAIPGEHLQVCPRGSTCCTNDMEINLMSLSKKEYETVTESAFKFIRSTFVSRAKKFDQFFTELLDNSSNDLHKMFVRTYGLLYQQNSVVFENLFRDLKLYYKGTNIDLMDNLNKFFTNLLQRMFQLLNGQYTFDSEYLRCLTRNMDNLKPFGDVPDKLKLQVRRAFIASRTFVQGLVIGGDVIVAMEMIRPTEACTRGITKMKFCPYCRGLLRTKPCNNYCLNTMKGCLADHSELNKVWNDYIEALKMVAYRLEGPFNIESVVEPMNVKLSEAIMNFQESSATVTEKIFTGCGTPQRSTEGSSRNKRSDASLEDYSYSKELMPMNRAMQNIEDKPVTVAGTNLDKLVKDIKDKVEEVKNFWVQLPYSICNGEIAAQPGQEEDCWNGLDRARYAHEVQKDGRMSQINNPEVTVDVKEENGIISVQIRNLKLITTKLQKAYQGDDVEWNTRSGFNDGIGEFSGSGDNGDKMQTSGDRDTEVDEVNSGSGSGSGPDDIDDSSQRLQTKAPTHAQPTRQPSRSTTDTGFRDPNKHPITDVPKPKPGDGNGSGTVSLNALVFVPAVLTIVFTVLVM